MEFDGTIELSGMEFHAHHGCFEQERREGNTFVVDFLGRFDPDKAVRTDRVEDTVDYGRIYDLVAEEMGRPSNLLEHAAGRIVRRVRDTFGGSLRYIQVTVSKKNPPVNGVCAWSRVTVTWGKHQNGRA